ncbi:dehydratase [Hydrogenophaga borbori]|uniref:Dehydratase n=1 Tax=Hydrogenophaga borbori TaxID=2294117 RepID=A0A372EHY8_9BURK|nr:MaoC/PaaZ C-terminal domain-containing protein [Hydrogenophaga borbori]RFP77950.1 dehydratase [Hydrogenophaga borbori]
MGWFFEDFDPQGEPVLTPERTISEADVMAFAELSEDNNPLHTDAEYAARTPMGQRVAHGLLVLSAATGLSAQAGQMQGTALAFLGMEEWKFLAPVFFGDRIRLRWRVADKRLASSGKAGVVRRHMEILNQRDEVVQSGLFATLVRTRA